MFDAQIKKKKKKNKDTVVARLLWKKKRFTKQRTTRASEIIVWNNINGITSALYIDSLLKEHKRSIKKKNVQLLHNIVRLRTTI